MPKLKEIIKKFEMPALDGKILAPLTPDERDFYEERAAIFEYDYNLPREDAERLALSYVLRRLQDSKQT